MQWENKISTNITKSKKKKKKEKEGDLLEIDTYQTVIYKFVDCF